VPDVAILGAGAVGALLGAALHRAGTDTVLVTREAGAAALTAGGLRVRSPRFGDGVVAVRAATTLDAATRTLVIAVKAPDLEAALTRVAAEPEVVVPLLNGIEHVAVLRERFGDSVVAASIRVQAHREGPAHVVHRAPFITVSLARPGAPALAEALRAADVEVVEGAGEADVLWGKLARLAGIALATAAADAPLGEVRDDAEAVAREVVPVGVAEGADLSADAVVAELRGLPDAATSSLRADLQAGVPDHELDAIAGAVVRAAARHGLTVPRTAALARSIVTRSR